ncbi:hypothetical protein MCOR12_002623 [Pyricularia oryzae]|nr:hypothetical protein MCOR12_002623 [Pyricularia oryzae]
MSYNPYMGFNVDDYGYYGSDQPNYEQPSGSAAPVYANPASIGLAPRPGTSSGSGQSRTSYLGQPYYPATSSALASDPARSSSRSGQRSSAKKAGSSSKTSQRSSRSAYPPTSMPAVSSGPAARSSSRSGHRSSAQSSRSAYPPTSMPAYPAEPAARPASRSSRRESLSGMYPPASMAAYDSELPSSFTSQSGRRESFSDLFPPTPTPAYDEEPPMFGYDDDVPPARSASRSARRDSLFGAYPPTSMSAFPAEPPTRSASRSGRRESVSGMYPPTSTTQNLFEAPARPTSRSGHGQPSSISQSGHGRPSSRSHTSTRSHRRSAEVPARPKSPKPSNRDAFGSRYKTCPNCGLGKLRLSSMTMCRACTEEASRPALGPGMPKSPSTTPYRPVVDLSNSGASRATPYPIPTWYTGTPVLGGTNPYRASLVAPRDTRICPCGRPNHDNLSIMCSYCQRHGLGR